MNASHPIQRRPLLRETRALGNLDNYDGQQLGADLLPICQPLRISRSDAHQDVPRAVWKTTRNRAIVIPKPEALWLLRTKNLRCLSFEVS